jgi:hypothetical protein
MQIYSGFVLSQDLVPQLIEGVGRPRGEVDRASLVRQGKRRCPANPFGCARHQSGLPLQLKIQ